MRRQIVTEIETSEDGRCCGNKCPELTEVPVDDGEDAIGFCSRDCGDSLTPEDGQWLRCSACLASEQSLARALSDARAAGVREALACVEIQRAAWEDLAKGESGGNRRFCNKRVQMLAGLADEIRALLPGEVKG